jgi:hypothetical protein
MTLSGAPTTGSSFADLVFRVLARGQGAATPRCRLPRTRPASRA